MRYRDHIRRLSLTLAYASPILATVILVMAQNSSVKALAYCGQVRSWSDYFAGPGYEVQGTLAYWADSCPGPVFGNIRYSGNMYPVGSYLVDHMEHGVRTWLCGTQTSWSTPYWYDIVYNQSVNPFPRNWQITARVDRK